jgi:molecular chaperone DnaK
MGYALGVDFGSTKTTVAMATNANGAARIADCVRLVAEMPSVVFLADDDRIVVGDPAEQLGLARPHRLIRGFKQRLGDPVPLMADGCSGRAESMVATVIGELVRQVAANAGAAPELIAVSYPAQWGSYKQALLSDALGQVGLTDVTLVAEPSAAVRNAVGNDAGISTVMVYDLGGDGFTACVMSRTPDGTFVVAGRPQELDGIGGGDFDQAVFSHVQRAVGLDTSAGADPEFLAAMRDLRLACRSAKEVLSLDTEVTIAVGTPHRHSRIRLVRSEFEELIRDAIDDTLDAVHRCLKSAALRIEDLDAVVLVGGSAQIPLVAQLISAEFEKPVIIAEHPAVSISLGAAQFAARAAWPEPAAIATPAQVDLSILDIADHQATELLTVQETPPERLLLPEPAEEGAEPAVDGVLAASRATVPAAPPVSAVALDLLRPLPGVVPIEPRGRHRHRGQRRYWFRTTGVVASVAAVLLLGTSIAASKAAEVPSPSSGEQLPANASTTGPAPVVGQQAAIRNARSSASATPVGAGGAGAPPAGLSDRGPAAGTTASSTAGPAHVTR